MKKSLKTAPLLFYQTFILAFLEGSGVMSVELLGAMLIAPYYGTTLYTWAGVIGVTLFSLTTGYFIGGRLGTKQLPFLKQMLYILFVISSLLIVVLPFVSHFLPESIYNIGMVPGMMICTFLLLTPSLFLLGATTPLLIRLGTSHIHLSGTLAGTVFGSSTLGGIGAAFLLGFFIVPRWGVEVPLLLTGLIVFLVVNVLLFSKRNSVVFLTGCLLLVFGGVYYFSTDHRPTAVQGTSIHRQAGILGAIRVADKKRVSQHLSPAEDNRFLYVNNIPQTCIINAPEAYSCSNYIHVLATFASLATHSPSTTQPDALLLGLGGGAIATELRRLGFSTDVVELDRRIIKVAADYFYFDSAQTRLIVDDARHYINTTKQKYDLVIFDIARGEAQPSYVFTMEGLNRLKELLNPQGFFMIELQGYAYGEKSRVFRSIYKTIQEAGYYTYSSIGKPRDYGDILLVGSNQPLNFNALKKEYLNKCCRQQPYMDALLQKPVTTGRFDLSQAVLLTDNQPLLEHLNGNFLYEWRKDVMQEVLK